VDNIERQTHTVRETAKILGINVTAAYALTRQKDFPGIRVGRRIIVSKPGLQRWLECQSFGKGDRR